MIDNLNTKNNLTLLSKFNDRDCFAYSEVYTFIYKSIFYYAYSLYKDTEIDCEDVIQDVFLEIWENKRLNFESIDKIKSYVFVAIKHKFFMYCRHKKFVDKAALDKRKDDDFFIIQAAESEIYSIIPEAMNLLPEECAESFRLFIEGYSIKQIAEHLNKPSSTIYSQKEKSISILRSKLKKDKLLFILLILCLS